MSGLPSNISYHDSMMRHYIKSRVGFCHDDKVKLCAGRDLEQNLGYENIEDPRKIVYKNGDRHPLLTFATHYEVAEVTFGTINKVRLKGIDAWFSVHIFEKV